MSDFTHDPIALNTASRFSTGLLFELSRALPHPRSPTHTAFPHALESPRSLKAKDIPIAIVTKKGVAAVRAVLEQWEMSELVDLVMENRLVTEEARSWK